MAKLDTYLQEQRPVFEKELSDFLRIPSVSAENGEVISIAWESEGTLFDHGRT